MIRRSSIGSELLPALLFAFIPLFLLGGITLFQLLRNVPDAMAARANMVLGFQTVQTAAALDEAVADAERGQRGYLITGRDEYLAPYQRSRERIPQLMAELQREISASSEQPEPRALLTLQSDITTKLNELADTIVAMREHGYDAAKSIVEMDGRRSMEAVQRDLSSITGAAERSLRTRLAGAEAAEQQLTLTFIFGTLIAAASLIAGASMLAGAYRRAASSERLLQATLESVREGVSAFDGGGRLQAWNALFARMIEFPAPLRRGLALSAIAPASPAAGAFSTHIQELDALARRTGQPALVERKSEAGNILEVFYNPTPDGGHVTTMLDVTARRATEEALLQGQKLEALGHMTGGVAHDFNNLLTVIIGGMGLVRRAVGTNAKALERIDMATAAAERGARLTRQLLAFARKQPLKPDIVNLNHLMTEVLPLVRRAVGDAITVEYVTGGGLWNTTVDAAQFQSAVLNLAINGRDAMREGGKIAIEAGNVTLDDAYTAHHADLEAGQYVVFAITDTGRGMDAATAARALDPFFTTKAPGEGTGLGLPQVYGFVKQSGGHLKIYSEVGEGTTVKLYLPRAVAQETVPARRRTPPALTGTEAVLLVDDDEIVRSTIAAMLEDLGYRVLTAANGTEAVAMLDKGAEIDLLFTDVVMPGPIGGRKLAERVREMRPSIKVLFTSGYAENAIGHNGRLDPGVELLSKPYDRERLAAKVRRVLDGATCVADEMRSA
jgi:signal transduction histidine kinase/ActR/RegA family two-component response regulator